MSLVLSVYTKEAFCDFLLPAITNEDTEIVLKKDIFSFTEDISIKLENVDNVWKLYETEEYSFQEKEEGGKYRILQEGVIFLVEENGEEISCIVRETESSFTVFHKIDISKETEITIGNDADNQICYQYFDAVSRHHAVLKRVERGFAVQDISSNGTFVNAKRIDGNKPLHFGDCINIFGLKIVYLGNCIAISAVETAQFAVSDKLTRLSAKEGIKTDAVLVEKKEKRFFHRAPRNYIRLENESVEIEAPPAPKQLAKKPLWMVIGPSFTMMLPMLAGSLLAIFSASSSGRNTSVFMYTGLITAGGSALIGAYWALTNIRYNKKETAKGEELRVQAYSEYLEERESLIKQKYEKYIKNLTDMYPEAATVTEYDSESVELWNRNQKHGDFLAPRLGLGDLEFPVNISIPKERFSLVTDELAEKTKEIKEKYSVMKNVPINLDFLQHRFLGVVGGPGKKGAFEVARILSAQIAACNCYTDVKLVYIYDANKEAAEWNYARWLPHVWSEDKKTRFVAGNKSEASDVFFELLQIFRIRAEEDSRKKSQPKPHYILLVSNPEYLEGELITKYIYESLPTYGLTTLFLVENEEELPNECEDIIKNCDEFSGFYNLNKEETLPIRYDRISGGQLERFARRILSIQVKETETGRDIPNALTFFEMYGISSLRELPVAENWRKNRTYENMKAMVGAKAGGVPCYLDAHEKYHGPHGLVAGTTGSGKSETLQTYMLSLALNFSPDDIGYFIIDYKGGGMAGLFDGLPHLIGAISNLSGSQVRRAMVSIKSENRRRQRIFSENNVNNINLYTKLYKSGEAKIPVPHMFIIVDEFAELKREEPEFMKELISVAQVGRSLGVHLILATQKPSGTVDDNIWSNSKFRLCLRVQDRQDSNDMLHKPDAAYITQAGRCYLQVGNDEIYELFQSGYSGAAYDDNPENLKSEVARMISTTGKASLIGNSLKRKQQEQMKLHWIRSLLQTVADAAMQAGESMQEYAADENRIQLFYENAAKHRIEYDYTENNIRKVENLIKATEVLFDEGAIESTDDAAKKLLLLAERSRIKLPEAKGKTQLDAVVEYLAKVAMEEGYGEQMKLWLQPLAEQIYLDDIAENRREAGTGWKKQTGKWNLTVSIGMCDDPENQAQFPLAINFAEGGHLAVCGSIVSGKSTFLQTLLFALIQKYQPDWVNLYVLDFSSHMLNAFARAPHIGGIMSEDDTEKIDKFFFMMENLMEERKKLLSGGNFIQYVQANGVVLPAVVIALDNIGAFREKTEGKYDDKLLRLLKEGISYGIFLVITSGGFSSSEISMKMGDNIKTVVCLQMNDKFAYSDALRKNHLEVLPENNIKGRGLAVVGDRVLEYQAALALRAEDDFQRMEKIERVCEIMAERWNGSFAKKIPMIPEQPVWSEYERLPEVVALSRDKKMLPIGYDMRSAEIYGINLKKVFTYLISGKNGTGKTNLQKAIIRAAAEKQGKIIVIEHTSAELKLIAKTVGAEYIATQAEQAEFFKNLLDPFVSRNKKKRALIEEGKDDDAIFSIMQEEIPYFIIIDDMTAFIRSMDNPGEGVVDIRGFVENISQKGKLHNIFFFIGVDQTTIGKVAGTKMLEGFLSARRGIHLGGAVEGVNYMDFSNLSYAEKNKVQKPGMALLPTANGEEVVKVMIPLVRG